MRTTARKEALHQVSGIFIVTNEVFKNVNFEQTRPVTAGAINNFIYENPWEQGNGVLKVEDVKITIYPGPIRGYIFALELPVQLRTGQLKAYENRLRLLLSIIQKRPLIFEQAMVCAKMLTTKSIEIK